MLLLPSFGVFAEDIDLDVEGGAGDEGAEEFTRPLGDIFFLTQRKKYRLREPPKNGYRDIEKT